MALGATFTPCSSSSSTVTGRSFVTPPYSSAPSAVCVSVAGSSAASGSCAAVTVTVCAVFQLDVVKVSDRPVGEAQVGAGVTGDRDRGGCRGHVGEPDRVALGAPLDGCEGGLREHERRGIVVGRRDRQVPGHVAVVAAGGCVCQCRPVVGRVGVVLGGHGHGPGAVPVGGREREGGRGQAQVCIFVSGYLDRGGRRRLASQPDGVALAGRAPLDGGDGLLRERQVWRLVVLHPDRKIPS